MVAGRSVTRTDSCSLCRTHARTWGNCAMHSMLDDIEEVNGVRRELTARGTALTRARGSTPSSLSFFAVLR